ncbi:TetR/AcrR family transcriptional regulator [Nonomuraea diastatica]|uniref:TetR/AcrR family transcriptional regulator n=1 Tax=Nonomuraea diastatica TaxID=1848329 RepID=A0A4R4WED9_9ACTN|nr:TetR/AcrR family transcriptional regulator [Nonomuraea diastatica]TDD17378.1 TetR/AcrR family transcriptional regulator [Nonomuraea diastatica]
MRSIYDRPPEDLTARARIRDAALAEFAERGFKGATMKAVADAAGVSVGLVQHHFGSKEGLREACDAHVRDTMLGAADDVQGGSEVTPEFIRGMYEASELSVRYLARALVEGSPVAAAMFDEGAESAERFLTGNWPDEFPPEEAKVRERAAVMAAMHLGTIVLHEHLSRRFGIDTLHRTNLARFSMAMVDVYAHMGEWIVSGPGSQVRQAVADYHMKEDTHD